MTSDARNALPTFDQCFQNWLDSQSDDDLREARAVGSDLLEGRCREELGARIAFSETLSIPRTQLSTAYIHNGVTVSPLTS